MKEVSATALSSAGMETNCNCNEDLVFVRMYRTCSRTVTVLDCFGYFYDIPVAGTNYLPQ